MDPIVGNKRLSSRVNHDENGDSGLFNGDFEKDGHEKYDNGNNGMEVDNPNRNDPMEESKQLAVDLDDLEHTMDSELAGNYAEQHNQYPRFYRCRRDSYQRITLAS